MNVDAPSRVIAEAIGMGVAARVRDDRAHRTFEGFVRPHFEAAFHHDAHVCVCMIVPRHDDAGGMLGRIDAQVAACHVLTMAPKFWPCSNRLLRGIASGEIAVRQRRVSLERGHRQ